MSAWSRSTGLDDSKPKIIHLEVHTHVYESAYIYLCACVCVHKLKETIYQSTLQSDCQLHANPVEIRNVMQGMFVKVI